MFNYINNFISLTPIRYFLNVVDILLVAIILYILYLLIYNTRAYVVIRGLFVIFILTILSKILGLQTVTWFFSRFFQVGIIAIVILFQAEIKQGLIILGSSTLFRTAIGYDTNDVQKIINAVYIMSQKHLGAIIVFQRKVSLHTFIEKSIALDARISSELIETIFYNYNPLHDGAMIINQNRIAATSAYLPLTTNEPKGKRRYGSRHRAALGISEQTDAVAIIVSEETSNVSIAFAGELICDLEKEETIKHLNKILGAK